MKKHGFAHTLVYLLLVFGALAMVFPFIWMLLCSFKTAYEIVQVPPRFFPSAFSFENFKKAFALAPFGKYFLNSVVVMLGSVLCTTFTTILGAFAFSRLRFPGREVLFSLLLSRMMIPFEMLILTNYTTIVHMGLYNKLPALLLPFVSSIFYTYILKGFFDTVPDSLYHSARLDGASNWKYLWRVLVPMARPSLVTIVI